MTNYNITTQKSILTFELLKLSNVFEKNCSDKDFNQSGQSNAKKIK